MAYLILTPKNARKTGGPTVIKHVHFAHHKVRV
jgi:hypothetical protein